MHHSILDGRDQIIASCRRHAVRRLDVFGSAARLGDFDVGSSDADFLVEFSEGSLAENYLELNEEFERILGRRVDLVDRQALNSSRNYIRRQHILSQAKPFYVA